MKKVFTLLFASLGLLVLVGGGCTNSAETDDSSAADTATTDEAVVDDNKDMMEAVVADDKMMEVDDAMISVMSEPDYDSKAKLKAITDDAATGPENGLAWADYNEDKGVYTVYATFDGLPTLDDDAFFYEGWIVRKGENMSVVSTGAVEYDASLDQWVNRYQSEQDLSDHDFYVLTLEPQNDDPAPAAHVLEGTLEAL